MKRLFSALFILLSSFSVRSQIVANDSAFTGVQSNDMTFYSLSTGNKTTVSNTDWHLAVSVRPSQFPLNTLQGTTLRINEAFGVKVYQVPSYTADSFNVQLNTTGYNSWLQMHDSDSLLDNGALNNWYNIAVYNYGWGTYVGPPSHDVVGNKVFLFELPGGVLKKFIVDQLDRDTAWVLHYANPDNSDFQTVYISKAAYQGKNLVYLDMLSGEVHDKEPLSADWDLQFTRYTASDIMAGKYLNTVGVLQNKNRTAAKRSDADVLNNDYSALNFSAKQAAIGWGWKHVANYQNYLSGKNVNFQDTYYAVYDSLTYFVNTGSGLPYKLVFTGYDINTGIISFYKEQVGAVSAIPVTHPQLIQAVYPNPATNQLNVQLDEDSRSILRIADLSGSVLFETTALGNFVSLETSALPNGLFTLTITQNGTTSVSKFIINR